MYTDEDLAAAAKAGVLSEDNIAAFRAFMAAQRQSSVADEEQFRLITSFNDVFVSIACGLVIWAISAFSGPISLKAAVIAAGAWGLAEYFTRKRRMALPSIILLIAFVGGCFTVLADIFSMLGDDDGARWPFVVAGLVTTGLGVLHWQRFFVPITIAAIAAVLVGVFVTLATIALDDTPNILWFVSGLAVLAAALYYDASDRLRQTRRADVAFWLHLLAAPLLVHPVFNAAIFDTGGAPGLMAATLVVAVYLLIAVFALGIDRRALMVSALGYVFYALNELLTAGGTMSVDFAVTAFLVGGFLLLLSAFWQATRQQIMRFCPDNLKTYLPPSEA